MPSVHITQSVSLADGRSYTPGTVVDMTADQVQEAVAGGWGEPLGEQKFETPEGNRSRRGPKAETRSG